MTNTPMHTGTFYTCGFTGLSKIWIEEKHTGTFYTCGFTGLSKIWIEENNSGYITNCSIDRSATSKRLSLDRCDHNTDNLFEIGQILCNN